MQQIRHMYLMLYNTLQSVKSLLFCVNKINHSLRPVLFSRTLLTKASNVVETPTGLFHCCVSKFSYADCVKEKKTEAGQIGRRQSEGELCVMSLKTLQRIYIFQEKCAKSKLYPLINMQTVVRE